MVIVCLAELNEEERAKGNSEGKFAFFPDTLGELWQDMADDNIITQVCYGALHKLPLMQKTQKLRGNFASDF